MNNWPLRFRFGIYAATLTTVAVTAALLAVKPLIYGHQLEELDAQLTTDAAEVFADLSIHGGSEVNFRKPIPPKYIPASLRSRYLQLNGPEGQVLYPSANHPHKDIASATPSIRTLMVDGKAVRVGTFVHGFLTVHIGTRLDELEPMQKDLSQTMYWVVPIVGLGVFVLGWRMGGRALKPVTNLTEAAERLSVSSPHQELPLPQAQDEIFRLTEVLNRSFAQMRLAYAASERFSADASHQLKTPLAVLRTGLATLRGMEETTSAQREEILGLERQTKRLTGLVEDLLLLAQADAGRLELEAVPLNFYEMVMEMVDDLGVFAERQNVHLETSLQEDLLIMGDPRRLRVILQNLGENAAKFCPPGGHLKVSCEASQGRACLRIGNSGQTVAPEARKRIFERFNRGHARENTEGHGLGLSIARSLAQAQGGDLVLREETGAEWTEFEFWLPLRVAG